MAFDILVCIDGHPKSHLLVEAGLNRARETGLSWCVLYIEQPLESVGSTSRREAMMRLLDRARDEGALIAHLEEPDSGKATLDYIRGCFAGGEPVGHIIVGQHSDTGLAGILDRPLAEKIARRYGRSAQVTIVPLEGHVVKPTLLERLRLGPITWMTFVAPVLAVFCAVMAAEALKASMPLILYKINNHNISLIFLLACVIVALRQGIVAALVASVLSSLVINYAYVIPIYRFNIGSLTDIINIAIFLIAAITVSVLGGHVRASAEGARGREQRSRALYDIARLTADADNVHQALEILDRELSRLFGMDIGFFLAVDAEGSSFEKYPAGLVLPDKDRTALEKCWAENRGTGYGTLFGFGTSWRFEPMTTADRHYGAFGVHVPLRFRLDPAFAKLMAGVADQVAATLERITLANEMSESRFREEREKLRSMLLSSVSHDLKTPLASIIGSLSVLHSLRMAERLTPEQARTLTETALEEAQRLDSFITNILSMTRIESGAVEFAIQAQDPEEPLGRVRKTMKTRLKGREVNVSNEANGRLVHMDSLMTGQVLQNVIDNAVKYSPDRTPIDIRLVAAEGFFEYRIRDHGPGIPDDKLDRVFDKYERLNKSDSQVAGTGLGLAIAKSVMQAQGGDIIVTNHPDGGAEFVLIFPLADGYATSGADTGGNP